VSVASAICIQCGASKGSPIAKCRACAFDPRDDEIALARSFLLSVERYDDGTDRRRYRGELDEVGRRIQAGDQVVFDDAEIQREIEIVRLGQRANWRDGLRAFFGVMVWLWPLGALALLGLYLALR